MSNRLVALIASFGVVVAASSAGATPLSPGGNVTPSTETALPAGSYFFGPQSFSITGTNALGQTRFTGTLTFAVYRESANGFLDFLYQYQNNPGRNDAVQHVSMTDFSNVTTDVTRITGTAPSGFVLGTVAPTDATRSASPGGVVSFDFTTPNSILPGRTSQVFVIHTNATDIVPGTTSVIDGGIATVVTRGPRNSPEPATLTLLGGGFLGLLGFFGRRRKYGAA